MKSEIVREIECTKLLSLIENWFPIYKVLAAVIAFVIAFAVGFAIGIGGTWVYFRYFENHLYFWRTLIGVAALIAACICAVLTLASFIQNHWPKEKGK